MVFQICNIFSTYVVIPYYICKKLDNALLIKLLGNIFSNKGNKYRNIR